MPTKKAATLCMLIFAVTSADSAVFGSDTQADAPPQDLYEFRFAFGTYCS